MPSFGFTLLTAACLVFVIEGLIYAFFPDSIKRLMAIAQNLPAAHLRGFGLVMALTGTLMLWLLKNFHSP